MRKYKYAMDYRDFKAGKFREGIFHEWGSSFVEFESGPGNFAIGIVENEDGTVSKPNADQIIFIDEPKF